MPYVDQHATRKMLTDYSQIMLRLNFFLENPEESLKNQYFFYKTTTMPED